MTDARPPHSSPRELPALDVWWDGAQWRRIGDTVDHSTDSLVAARPWNASPAQRLPDGGVPDGADVGIPLVSPAASPWPDFTHPPGWYQAPPRRSRVDSSLWALAIGGVVFFVISLLSTMNQGARESRRETFVEIPIVAPAGAAGALPLDSAEAFAASYRPKRAAEGAYVASAQEIARAFGAELVWSDSETPDPASKCTRNTKTLVIPVAWYCVREPYLIHLNRSSPTMPALLYTPELVDSVKHELAHLAIHQRCGESRPDEGTVEIEGVTNSYAVLYLGGNRDVLGDVGPDSPQYAMTTQTDDVATWIHAGVCWYETGGTAQ